MESISFFLFSRWNHHEQKRFPEQSHKIVKGVYLFSPILRGIKLFWFYKEFSSYRKEDNKITASGFSVAFRTTVLPVTEPGLTSEFPVYDHHMIIWLIGSATFGMGSGVSPVPMTVISLLAIKQSDKKFSNGKVNCSFWSNQISSSE